MYCFEIHDFAGGYFQLVAKVMLTEMRGKIYSTPIARWCR